MYTLTALGGALERRAGGVWHWQDDGSPAPQVRDMTLGDLVQPVAASDDFTWLAIDWHLQLAGNPDAAALVGRLCEQFGKRDARGVRFRALAWLAAARLPVGAQWLAQDAAALTRRARRAHTVLAARQRAEDRQADALERLLRRQAA